MRTSLAFAALLFSSLVLADEPTDAVRKQIVDLTQQLMGAVGDGKPEVWQRALLDDALVTDEFGRRQTKKEIVDSIHPFPADIVGSIDVRDPHVRVYGNTAVIDFEDYEKEAYFGRHFLVRYISTATYIRRGDEWKLATMLDVTLQSCRLRRQLSLRAGSRVDRRTRQRKATVAHEGGSSRACARRHRERRLHGRRRRKEPADFPP
jgi:hypothetical protein